MKTPCIGVLVGFLIAVVILSMSSCTMSIMVQNGIDRSSDVADSDQEASADVKADIPVSLTK